jgi:DNA invertase Pin-like site-specific DNA recombinase
MARALIATRESRTGETGTSLDGQVDLCIRWAELHGHTVVHVTQDASTSGSVAPAERQGLGPWLTEPRKLSQWDLLISAKLDRISRSLIDFVNLYRDLAVKGKSYASVTESVDFSTPAGKAFAQILMVFAEFELETIKARCRERDKRHAQNGTWRGGVPPFGWQPVRQGRAYVLEPHPVQAPIVRQAADALIAGKPTTEIAKMLSMTTVGAWQLLRKPVTRNLLDRNAQIALDDALRCLSRPVSQRTGDGYLLTGVAVCGTCDGPLYAQFKHDRGYGYYRCRNGHTRCRIDELDSATESALIKALGERPVMVTDASAHDALIAELEMKLETLRSIPEVDASPVAERLAALRSAVPEPTPLVRDGKAVLVRDAWSLALSVSMKRQLLLDCGIKVTLTRDGAHVTDK